MTTKLEVFRAELEALEAADGYGEPHYDYLVEQVERLEAEERSPQWRRIGGLTIDPTNSPEMRLHNDAARAAQAAHNSGASDSDGAGPVQDPTGYLSGGGSGASGGTWADPSSQG